MYIYGIQLKNIRSIIELNWRILPESAPGWHVIIGDNGSGKSTLLRAIALALVGPTEAIALRQDWNEWLSRDQSEGHIKLSLRGQPGWDEFFEQNSRGKNDFVASIDFARHPNNGVEMKKPGANTRAYQQIWGGKSGWFSVAYGPFRRFTGGDRDYEKLFDSNPKLAAHLSVFGEDVALTESIKWLQELQFKKLEAHSEGRLLDAVKNFVNQPGFLPHHTKLEQVSSRSVDFVDGNGNLVAIEELSDGYRSILSLTFELIRQLSKTYGEDKIFDRQDPTKIDVPGVVLIDEIDAHLHPTWQRQIGLWLREHFPKLQFIVTTHSPLICQAATVGTVWRLARPGSDQPGGMVSGTDLERLLYGNVLDAYSTEIFGANVTRSEESKKLLQRLAELNHKELTKKLTRQETQEQAELRATLPTAAHQMNQEFSDKDVAIA